VQKVRFDLEETFRNNYFEETLVPKAPAGAFTKKGY
jgi:hypothetical protein